MTQEMKESTVSQELDQDQRRSWKSNQCHMHNLTLQWLIHRSIHVGASGRARGEAHDGHECRLFHHHGKIGVGQDVGQKKGGETLNVAESLSQRNWDCSSLCGCSDGEQVHDVYMTVFAIGESGGFV